MRSSVLVFLAFLAGCTDGEVELENLPPETPAVAISPGSPRTDDDLRLEVRGSLVDPEGGEVSLRVRWFKDNQPQADLDDAVTVPADRTEKEERWEARVQAVDSAGAASSEASAVAEIRNADPEVELSFDPAAPTPLDELRLVIDASDDDGDSVLTTITWRIDDNPAPQWNDFTRIPAGTAVRGQVWEATVVPRDADDEGQAEVLAVTFGDAPPVISAVTLSPSNPREGDVLDANARATDPEGDAVTFSYRWLVNGVALVGPSGRTLDSSHFNRDDEVVAEVVAVSAGGASSVPTASQPVTVRNSAPTAGAVTISPGSGGAHTTFTCTAGTLTDPDPNDNPLPQVTWLLDGNNVGSQPTISGPPLRRGGVLGCRVVANDGTDSSAPASSANLTLGNAPPVTTAGTLGPTPASVASTISVSGVQNTDLDGDAVTVRYAWQVDGAPIAPTTATLAAPHFRRGQSVVAVLTPHDGRETGTSFTTAPLVVGNAPPAITALTFSPGYPNAFEPLRAVPVAADPDGDTLTLSYAWTVNGAAAGTNADTLPQAAFRRGDQIGVTVQANDGQGGTASRTATATIGNAPPSAPVVRLTPAQPRSTDDLRCEVTTPGVDPDGSAVTHAFVWTVDSQLWTGAVQTAGLVSTIDSDATLVGDVWACQATASDGSVTTPGGAASVTVLPVTCPTDAADDGTGVCACDVGFEWCSPAHNACCPLPQLTFDFHVLDAEVNINRPNGDYWDNFFGLLLPDVAVELLVDGVSLGTTSEMPDTDVPVWNEYFDNVTLQAGQELTLRVLDNDVGSVDVMGRVTVTYNQVVGMYETGVWSITFGSVYELRMEITAP